MNEPPLLKGLSTVQALKFFSHYGLRTLLVLYLTNELKKGEASSLAISAVFCALIELGSILGGLLADRFLGLRFTTLLGALLLAFGYSCLALENVFFYGLALVMVGGSLFSSNLTGLLSKSYGEEPSQEKGFTFFYVMQNAGAFISTLLCSFLAPVIGYSLCLLFAASGFVAGAFLLFRLRKRLPCEERKPCKKALFLVPALFALFLLALQFEEGMLKALPFLMGAVFLYFLIFHFRTLRPLLIPLLTLILFYALEDQICSSLILFAEKETQRTVLGWEVSGSVIMSINPLVILLLGAWVSKRNFGLFVPLLLTAFSFTVLALCCFFVKEMSILIVIGVVALISLAELMVGPLVLAAASKTASKEQTGMVMGMIPLAFSLAFILSAFLGKMVMGGTSFGQGWVKMAILTFLGACVIKGVTYYAKRRVYRNA